MSTAKTRQKMAQIQGSMDNQAEEEEKSLVQVNWKGISSCQIHNSEHIGRPLFSPFLREKTRMRHSKHL